MVAGMLTAIRDFARDSFRVADDDTLDNFRIGELSVWVEQGPHAILAVVIRGNAPGELRERMQETLEHVHARMGEALASFSGDTAPFEVVQPALESCLESRYQPPRKGIPPVVWIAVAALVIAIGAWMYLAYAARARWNGYLDALRAEPGVVVVSSDRRDGRYVVSGLRDPLARDPASLLGAAGLSEEDVAGQWELYQALEPSIVLARARQLLQAPESVTFAFDGGTLTATGAAPVAWIRDSRRLAPLVPGVSRFDTASLVDAELRRIGDELSSSPLLFVRGTMNAEEGTEAALTAHLERVRQLDALAELAGGPLVIEIVGHADGDGSPHTNDSLSVSRANVVRSAIEALRLPNIRTTARGVGSSQPASAGTTESDKRANRRVTLQVVRPQ